MTRRRWFASIAGAAACGRQEGRTVSVAAAANLSSVMGRIGLLFQQTTGIRAEFSFASTAQLTRQIENGAPFDLFAAADSEHIEQLAAKGLIDPSTRAVYAIGVLALWMPKLHGAGRLEDLLRPDVRIISVAKPELAPYGAASMEVLARAGLADRVKPKLVFAENINMATQYGASGNADAVFTAYSLVKDKGIEVQRIDRSLHAPIRQELAILRAAPNAARAVQFRDFLLTGAGRGELIGAGYEAPAR